MVNNPKLLLVTYLVINRWQFHEILESYDLTNHECTQLLAQLDHLKIIELLPKYRIKLLTARNFSWLKNGPVQQFFRKHVLTEYFDSSFENNRENLRFVAGLLSADSYKLLDEKFKKIIGKFDELCYKDEKLPLDERDGYCMVLAVRNWELSAFQKMRKDGD